MKKGRIRSWIRSRIQDPGLDPKSDPHLWLIDADPEAKKMWILPIQIWFWIRIPKTGNVDRIPTESKMDLIC